MSDWYDDDVDPVDEDAVADEDDEFDWDQGNLEHFINSHGVSPEEAAEAVLDPRAIGVGARNSANERRWAVVGATEDGRILYVVFTRRLDRIRIISAWDAGPADRRRYRRR